jgi:hypothetical protein
MKALFVAVLGLGIAVLSIGIAIAQGSGTSDPGTRSVPTVLGVGIGVGSVGGTIAATAIGLAIWFAPVARAHSRLRRENPAAMVRVVQPTYEGKVAIEQAIGRHVELPSYLVVATTAEGVAIWSTGRRAIMTIPVDRIQSVEVGETITSRPVPSVILNSTSGDDAMLPPFEFVPSREGLELFPILRRELTEQFADQLREALTAGLNR